MKKKQCSRVRLCKLSETTSEAVYFYPYRFTFYDHYHRSPRGSAFATFSLTTGVIARTRGHRGIVRNRKSPSHAGSILFFLGGARIYRRSNDSRDSPRFAATATLPPTSRNAEKRDHRPIDFFVCHRGRFQVT